ncbi:MAG: hypothetical protein WCD45_02735 [Gallionella sp.]
MLTLPLDPTDDRANPDFKDAGSCQVWLAQFQLTNLQRAHGQLLTQLNELNRYPMHGLERLRTLEALRETVDHIQEEMAKKLVAKALPLSEHELMIFVAITQLWQAMVGGYQRCLQAYLAGDKKLADIGAMLCQRCLLYGGAAIFEHLRSGYECNAKFWYQLHDLYAFAEEHKLHELQFEDSLNLYGVSESCRSIYVKTLLACYARPAELSRTQLKLLDRWLATWSKEVSVDMRYSTSKGDAQPLAVDLSDTQGLQTIAQAKGLKLRYLPMVPMSKLLRVKIILLQQGASLEEVGLGELPSNNVAIELLMFLHECWCEEDKDRSLLRDRIGEQVLFCYTPEMIFAGLKGRVIGPSFNHNMDNQIRKQQENFGRVVIETKPDKSAFNSHEEWMLDDESVLGAKLTRQNHAQGRLSLHQLVAVQRYAQQPFRLGAVAWLNISVRGLLQLGISYLPGTPEPVHVQVASGSLQVAFLMPAVVASRSPASLIVPRNIYKAGGLLQITHANGAIKNAKMGISVTRGYDYERISFTLN